MLPPAIRKRHFFREVFAERPAEDVTSSLEAWSEEEVRGRCDLAWRSNDTAAFLEAANWLRRNDVLRGFEAKRLSRRLNELGRYAEALSILSDGRYAQTQEPHYWGSLAIALAGTDQLAQASEALERAQQLGGETGPKDHVFAEALRVARAQEARLEQITAWAELAALAETYLLLGLPRRASDALTAAFGKSLPKSEDDVVQGLHLAQFILKIADPDLAAEFAASMSPHFESLGLSDQAEAARPGIQLCLALAQGREDRLESAVELLAPLAQHRKDAEFKGAEYGRLELCRTVGQLVQREVRPRFGRTQRPKIVDMFTFNNELLMLRVKLEEMYDWVDHFVIVEAPLTFSGRKKPLYFDLCKSDFSKFEDKIVHVVVEDLPPWTSGVWTRQLYQRDSGLRALKDLCGDDDIVLVTDVDEIIDRRVIESMETPFASLAMPSFWYFFNLERIESRQSRWSAAVKARYLEKMGASYARYGLPHYAKQYVINDAGWHFSLVRDADGLASKFDSYSSTQHSGQSREHFEKFISNIRAAHGLPGFLRREIDKGFPEYIRNNTQELGTFIL